MLLPISSEVVNEIWPDVWSNLATLYYGAHARKNDEKFSDLSQSMAPPVTEQFERSMYHKLAALLLKVIPRIRSILHKFVNHLNKTARI